MTAPNAENYYGWHLAERRRQCIAEGWQAWVEEWQRAVEKWQTWAERWQRVAERWQTAAVKYISTLADQRRTEHRNLKEIG
jgi:hypothetical protein